MDDGNNMSACSRIHCLCLGWWWKLKLIFNIEPRFTFEWCRLLCVPSAAAEARLIIRGQFLRMCLFVYLRIYLTRMNIEGSACARVTTTGHLLTSSQTSATHRHSHLLWLLCSSYCKPVFHARKERIGMKLSFESLNLFFWRSYGHSSRSMVVWQTYILEAPVSLRSWKLKPNFIYNFQTLSPIRKPTLC